MLKSSRNMASANMNMAYGSISENSIGIGGVINEA